MYAANNRIDASKGLDGIDSQPMTKPQLSFLISSYNHQAYVCQTLDSVMADMASVAMAFEIVLIDDGSTDDSVVSIQRWHRDHPNAPLNFVSRENRGLCRSVNEMLALAQGDIIRLIASDDLIFPGSTQRILEALGATDAMAIIGDVKVIDAKGKILADSGIEYNGGRKAVMRTPQGLRDEILENWSIPGPCLTVRRSVYDLVGGYAEDLLVEDWDFYLRLVAKDLAVFVDTPVAYYRLHGLNASRTRHRDRRIAGLSSLLAAGEKRADLFTGHDLKLLKREVQLLRLKVLYLRRDVVRMPSAMIRYAAMDLGIRFSRKREVPGGAQKSFG